MQPNRSFRLLAGISCCLGLMIVFIFQGINVGAFFGVQDASTGFLINRALRFILNDALTIGLIYAIFAERKYVVFSLWVELTGLVIFLIPYFILKVNFPSYNGPLISFLHRLILNPTLLLLLIPAFYFQRKAADK